MKLRPWWSIEGGSVWYQPPGREWRIRGVVRVCRQCDEEFPALKSNPGIYCSKRCLGRVIGGSNRVCHTDLFEQWTPEECWLAGVLWTDGTYYKAQRGYAAQVIMTDEDVVSSAARIVGADYHTVVRPAPRKPVYRFKFCEASVMERLGAAGMALPKLDGRPFPDLPHSASFLRGAFEGDGYVLICPPRPYRKRGRTYMSCLTIKSSICGGRTFLEGVQEYLSGCGIAPKRVKPHGSIWRIDWAMADTLRLEEIMYAERGPFMLRKRAIFSDFRNACRHAA